MGWLKEKFWDLIDHIDGDRVTVEIEGPMSQRQLTLRPSLAASDVEIGVRITQYSYKTTYKRWWKRSTVHSVYRVIAFAPEEIRARLDPRLFEPLVYPLLCNRLLNSSKFPHLYALHAFLHRISPFYPNLKIEL